MKKIIFGITGLTLGGAERVLVDLANELSTDYDITIFTIYAGGELKSQLNSKIKTISLYDKPFSNYSFIEKIKISLKLLFKNKPPEGYDTEIAFLEGPITRLFSKYKTGKKIVWVHNDISKVFGSGIKGKIKKLLDKKTYKKYNEIVFVSEENRDDFNKVYGKFSNEQVIRNYLNYQEVIRKSEEKIDLPYSHKDINLVSVCRLTEQKGIDRFIKVHSKLEKDGIHSKVYIVGDGPLRYNLQKEIDNLGETENFYLLGAKENPYPYIKNADIFCLLSYYEGYGMVIDEAKLLCKTIIITDTAAKEGVKKYKKAIITPNTEEGMYNALKKEIVRNSTEKNEQEYCDTINKEYYENIIRKVKEII